jgi:hypothetical protein
MNQVERPSPVLVLALNHDFYGFANARSDVAPRTALALAPERGRKKARKPSGSVVSNPEALLLNACPRAPRLAPELTLDILARRVFTVGGNQGWGKEPWYPLTNSSSRGTQWPFYCSLQFW